MNYKMKEHIEYCTIDWELVDSSAYGDFLNKDGIELWRYWDEVKYKDFFAIKCDNVAVVIEIETTCSYKELQPLVYAVKNTRNLYKV